METALADGLTAVTASITTVVTAMAPKIAVAAGVGITLGSVGFGIKYLWRVFRGTAK